MLTRGIRSALAHLGRRRRDKFYEKHTGILEHRLEDIVRKYGS